MAVAKASRMYVSIFDVAEPAADYCPSHRVLRDIAAYTMVVGLTFARVQIVEGRKPDQFKHCVVPVSTDHHRSFCRKTTLTKHFRRWHTDEETSSEEGSDLGPEDAPEQVSAARQSSLYVYRDLWPLPAPSAQQGRPLSFQATLASRPKSAENMKVERTASVGSDHVNDVNAAVDCSFGYLRARTDVTPDQQILVRAALPSNFSNIPISRQYTSDNGVETWSSPMEIKTSLDRFPEYLPTPTSAQSNLVYFPEPQASYPLQVATISLSEPIPCFRDGVTTMQSSGNPLLDSMSNSSRQENHYSLGSASAPEPQMQFSSVPMPVTQQPPVPPISMVFNGNPQYNMLDAAAHYYGPGPDWYLDIKADDALTGPHGPLPGQMGDFY